MALIVNGKKITDEQLWSEMENLKASAPVQPNCCEEDDEYMGYAKDNMVARTLLLEIAEEKNITVAGNRVDTAFESIVEEAGGKEHFYINYNTSEGNEDEFKKSPHDNLLMQDVIQNVLGAKQKPTGEELKAYYEEHIDRYMHPEKAKASHILKSLDHGADPVAAYNLLRDLRKQLKNGADFAALSDEHSDNPGDGGDLGIFSQGELVPEFESVAFSLDVGELSPVFVTPFGYHLVKLVEKFEREPIALDEIREQVIEHFIEETHNDRVRKYIETLKAKATIEELDEGWVTGDAEDGDEADVDVAEAREHQHE